MSFPDFTVHKGKIFTSQIFPVLLSANVSTMGKGTKNIAFYLLMLLVFGSLMYLIVKEGESQQFEPNLVSVHQTPTNLTEGFSLFQEMALHNIESSMGKLLLQIITILLTCRLFGWLFQKIGQPTVIGEIVAGIVLGPSVLGHLFPHASAFLFPVESLGSITILSQFGLILFMFAIGMELNLTEVRKKLKETILISHTSTIVPFFCGMLTAYCVYDTYADRSTPFLSFALFIGIAMSITAFPVLARIIQEKGMTKTHLGTIALASAANGDITAWCLLAVVIAIAQAGTMLSAIYNILFAFLYILMMFLIVRPFLRMVGQIYHNKEVVDKGLVAFIFLLVIASSYLTEILGLHALFGAFIAGVVMPDHVKFRKIMTEKVEDVSLALFLPLFFVSTGLRTEIGLLDRPELWWVCLLFIVVAIVGKFGGAFLSARFVGESWRDSLYIGALMNTRGLMELVVLTIGYEMGILTPAIFVVLVLMTLVTTFMTTPLVSLIQFIFHTRDKRLEAQASPSEDPGFQVLLSFGRAGSGPIMLNVADQLFSHAPCKLRLTALHLTVGSDINPLHTDNFEEISFAPILSVAKKLGLQIQTRYEVSNDASEEICRIVNEEEFDFLLVGAGISMSNSPNDMAANHFRHLFNKPFFRRFKGAESWFYPGALLKDKTKQFIEQSHCPVGVFVNRDFMKASDVLVVVNRTADQFLFSYLTPLLNSTHGLANILLLVPKSDPRYGLLREAIELFLADRKDCSLLSDNELSASLLSFYNFMLISYESWNMLSEQHKETLQRMPSTLILSPGNAQKSSLHEGKKDGRMPSKASFS